MSIESIIGALLASPRIKCNQCKAVLIIQEDDTTIIKNKLVKINRRKGILEIKCSQCGKIQIICNN